MIVTEAVSAGFWHMRRGLLASLMTSTALCLAVVPASMPKAAYAQTTQTHRFNIPSQPLNRALRLLADQSGIQLAYQTSVASGTNSPALSGTMTSEEALARLLNGSGLSYGFTGVNTVTIRSKEPTLPQTMSAEGTTLLDTITVTTGLGATLADAPYQTAGSSNYISEKEIERFRGTSVGDFLKGTPGVLSGDNRNSGAVDINVRGMQGFGRVPVVIDGAQQQNVVYRGYSGVASRNYVDPDMIGGVMIEKGPTTGVYGVGATGGLAVMRTLEADDIITGDKNWGIRVRGSVMSNTSSPPPEGTTGGIYGYSDKSYRTDCSWACNPVVAPETLPNINDYMSPTGMDRPAFLEPTSGSGSVAFAARWENAEIVAAYTRRKTGNYYSGTHGDVPEIERIVERVPATRGRWVENTVFRLTGLNRYRGGEEVLNTSQDNTSYLLKGKMTFEGGHSLKLGYMRYNSHFGELMPSVIVRGEGVVQAPLSEVTVNTFTSRYEWNPDNTDLINLTANLWHTNTETQILTPYEFFGIDMSDGYWDIAKRTGFDLSNKSLISTAWGDVTLNYGGSYTYETLAPPDDIDLGASGVTALQTTRDGWRREASGFVASECKPQDWLKLEAALRYTWSHSYDNNPERIVRTDTYMNNDQSNSGFAPVFAVTVEPIEGIQFYSRYAEAIRSPSLFESTSGWSFGAAPTLNVKPEHAKNWEFGFNVLEDDVFTSGDKVRFKAAYFNNTIDNYLTRTTQTVTEGANVPSVAMRNLKYAKFRGFEASAEYDNGRFFTQASGIYYKHMEFCTKEEEIYSIIACRPGGVSNGFAQLHLPPKMTGSITLGTRWFDEKLELGGRVSYTGKRATDTSSANSGFYTAAVNWTSYTLLDLFGSYKINDKTTFDFAVDNATDVYYMDALTLGLMPSPGRTVRASLTAKF
ncbi:TonB-dependent receptor [Ochrobactrum sp. MYb379]|uniref:TonB-dependent receptor n=1 Tax=Ochrobactrum sp. MYb379 TaxID=2745275 RepID=UPI0030997451